MIISMIIEPHKGLALEEIQAELKNYGLKPKNTDRYGKTILEVNCSGKQAIHFEEFCKGRAGVEVQVGGAMTVA